MQKTNPFPRRFRGNMALPTAWFWTSTRGVNQYIYVVLIYPVCDTLLHSNPRKVIQMASCFSEKEAGNVTICTGLNKIIFRP